MLKEQAPSPGQDGNAHAPGNYHFLVYLAGTGATHIHPMGRAATDALFTRLDLRPGMRVLEIGCGTGGTMARLAPFRPDRIDGVDLLPSMLAVARKRLRLVGLGKRVHLRLLKPGEPLPFATAAYDRVYAESVAGFQD